jgi:hypothetical protein
LLNPGHDLGLNAIEPDAIAEMILEIRQTYGGLATGVALTPGEEATMFAVLGAFELALRRMDFGPVD